MPLEEIPDKNVYMLCKAVNKKAFRNLPAGFHFRQCREQELDIWKAMPFDNKQDAEKYHDYMTEFFKNTYGNDTNLFYKNTIFVCNQKDEPVGTCSSWKAYGKFQSIHWLKVIKEYEGQGLGRALLTHIMERFEDDDYPVYIHTQPGSYRAIKLYSDFGFQLITSKFEGIRPNQIEEYLPILEKIMPAEAFHGLIITEAPADFIKLMSSIDNVQF